MGRVITLNMSQEEISIARIIASLRHLQNRSNNIQDRQMGKQDSWEIDADGILAEMAFGKQFNIYPDFSLSPRAGGFDLKLKNGKTVDIKATRYKNGRLLATTKQDGKRADIYVLAIIEKNIVSFAGWSSKENFIKDENIIDLGHGKTYALTQDKLAIFPYNGEQGKETPTV